VHVGRGGRESISSGGTVHVSRRGIYDRDLRLAGFELLFRDTAAGNNPAESGDLATSPVIIDTFAEFGLNELMGGRLGFLNVTRAFVVGELPLPFGPDGVVLEIAQPDNDMVAGLRRLKAAGYALALDDFTWLPGVEPLLELADYVKLDVLGHDAAHLTETLQRCQPYHVRAVATRVEDAAALQRCQSLGFDLFQGWQLSKARALSIDAFAPSHASALRLLGQISEPDADIGRIEELVRLDAMLSYRLLSIVNSAETSFPRQITSVREAIVLVGLERLRAWLVLITLGDVTGTDDERLSDIVVRARTCELLAHETGHRRDGAFTLGLLHGVSELMGVGLDELAGRLNLGGMFASDPQVLPHAVLDAVLAHERTDLDALAMSGFAPFEVSRAYLAALGWSLQLCKAASG
jgi:c-di-GMP-related signal transduction protein